MDWGLKNRIASIIKPTNNRGVMLAIDHGYFLGPTEKLEVPKRTISPLLKYCDSLMVTRGIVRTSVDPNFPVPIVLRVSGGSSIIGEDLSNEKITTSVKDAVRINASALAMSIFVGAKYEHNSLVGLGNLVNEAEEYGLPVLAVTAVGKELEKRDARYLSLSCRIAAEFGAHIVKTYYCDNFEKVVNSCPVPVIIAGGPKIPERDALALTYNGIKAGAAGVDMGRNIWQSQYPIPMIRAVRAIVHSNYNLNQAYELFQKLCKDYPVRNNPSQNFPGKMPQNPQRPQQNQQRPQQNPQRPQQKQQQNQQRPPQSKPQQTKPQQNQPKPPQKQPQPTPQQNQQRPPQKQQQPKPQQQSKPKPQKSEPKKQPTPAAAKTQ